MVDGRVAEGSEHERRKARAKNGFQFSSKPVPHIYYVINMRIMDIINQSKRLYPGTRMDDNTLDVFGTRPGGRCCIRDAMKVKGQNFTSKLSFFGSGYKDA